MYDDLFEEKKDSVFKDKAALDPFQEPVEIVSREEQEEELAEVLKGVYQNYLPPTVSIYGPPGTGKTLTTRRICREFSDRCDDFEYVYVNLKECRSIFSAANEILYPIKGERKESYEGLDGVFKAIWNALENYPDFVVLILDEIDHVKYDKNYDPSDFLYRLLRGEGKISRSLNLSVFLVSNELLQVDLKLDSRVRSAMGRESVFFPPYNYEELVKILAPRTGTAFRRDAIDWESVGYAASVAGTRWGDARKALTLLRNAGEYADKHGDGTVTKTCVEESIEEPEKEDVADKLMKLPSFHYLVLYGAAAWINTNTGDIVQPVTTKQIKEYLDDTYTGSVPSDRAVREILTDLETMGLVETWIESKGDEGRVKQVETTVDPEWIRETFKQYAETSPNLNPDS